MFLLAMFSFFLSSRLPRSLHSFPTRRSSDLALVSEDSGIADIRKIIFDARNFLNFGGWLILEHAYDQGVEVRQLMMDASYCEIKTFSDISDLDRVTICKKTSN